MRNGLKKVILYEDGLLSRQQVKMGKGYKYEKVKGFRVNIVEGCNLLTEGNGLIIIGK